MFIASIIALCSVGILTTVMKVIEKSIDNNNHLIQVMENTLLQSQHDHLPPQQQQQYERYNRKNHLHKRIIVITINHIDHDFLIDMDDNDSIYGVAINFCSKKGNLFSRYKYILVNLFAFFVVVQNTIVQQSSYRYVQQDYTQISMLSIYVSIYQHN